MPKAEANELQVDGRRLPIRNLDRVIFPNAGTTKAELLEYYVSVADAMLPHLRERLLHLHRYPEGVTGPRFWQKDCPDFRPDWMPVAPVWSRDKGENINYCVLNELASLLWAVNIGSVELHTSLHERSDLHRPTVLAFDLDPGEGTTIVECCEVALRVRELLRGVGLAAFPKTSGSKGLQVYVPLNTDVTYDVTKPIARRIAELLEEQTPASVSTPVGWDEVERALHTRDPAPLSFEMGDVPERVARHGDLFADVLTLRQAVR